MGPSFQGDGAQSEACLVRRDPDFSLAEHHPLVSNEDRLEGGFRDDLPDVLVHDPVLLPSIIVRATIGEDKGVPLQEQHFTLRIAPSSAGRQTPARPATAGISRTLA